MTNLDALIDAHNTNQRALNTSIVALVKHINKVYKDFHNGLNDDTRFDAEVLSNKWVRINQQVLRDGEFVTTSVYCFVALSDNENKALGKVTAGDIHKAAGFKQPAKHARGSVLNEATWTCIGPYGVAYLISNHSRLSGYISN